MRHLIIISFLFLLASCNNFQQEVKTGKISMGEYSKIGGFAQGTTWTATYKSQKDYTLEVDSILKAFDNSMSVYNKESNITKLNNNISKEVDEIFVEVFNESYKIYQESNHVFDPTIYPIVKAWGFTKQDPNRKPKQSEIDSMLQFVGMNKLKIVDNQLIKEDSRTTLVFNAIAQGYSSDLIGRFFEKEGIEDYVVEVGGEVYAHGKNPKGKPWHIGVDLPKDSSTIESREVFQVVAIDNQSICTSGNYRNFFYEDGVKYSHEVDARTGYPKRDSLLSVSVLAPSAIMADGYATAIMSLGLKEGLELVNRLDFLEALFIYSSSQTDEYQVITTPGFKLVEQ